MAYLIYARDFEGMDLKREEVREAHREHLRSMGDRLLASGALLDDEGKKIIGGVSLIDTEDRIEAEKFAYEDPYEKAGIRRKTVIIKWRKKWWSGKFLKD